MMQTQFEAHYSVLRSNLPSELASKVTPKFQNFKYSYAIDFENKAQADSCWGHFKGIAMRWIDPRTSQTHDLRLGKDQPLPVRHKAYALGLAYNIIQAEMKSKKLWNASSMKLGTNPFQGILYLMENGDPFEMVKLKEVNGNGDGRFEIGVDAVSFKHFHLEESFTNGISDRVQALLAE
ncbi:unnamed protein product [Prorocentrum cordatum]|uniref:Uncharacterized protein n=1 Tax=Prorocentrum cordatum TaxID=2364126 RepID=A0ABN9SF29_9DINO|nr:unnamed protein product [Polarella glacialis]